MGRKDIRSNIAARAAEHRRLMDELEELLKDPSIPESEKVEPRKTLAKARQSRVRYGQVTRMKS
jgi:hypothetical protein